MADPMPVWSWAALGMVLLMPLLARGAFALLAYAYLALGRPRWIEDRFAALTPVLWVSVLALVAAAAAVALAHAQAPLVAVAFGKLAESWWVWGAGFVLVGVLVGVILGPLDERILRARNRPELGTPNQKSAETLRSVVKAPLPMIAAIVLLEEFLWRGFLFWAFQPGPPYAIGGFVLLSAVSYGVAHEYWGPRAVLVHAFNGLVYTALFLASGWGLAAPVAAHLTFNVITILGERSAAPVADSVQS